MKYFFKLPVLLLIAVAGAISVFAFAPLRFYGLIFLSLLIPAFFIQRYPHKAFYYGYTWGICAYAANFYWIYYSLHDIAGLTPWLAVPLVFLFPAYLALYPGFAFWLSCRLTSGDYSDRFALRWLAVFPACWMLTEWLRSWILTGFSWGEIGYTQITESPLAGYAPVLGIHGVTLIVAWITGSMLLVIWKGWFHFPTTKKAIGLILTSMVIVFCSGSMLKSVRWTEVTGYPINVALGQGNISQSIKWDPAAFQSTLEIYFHQVARTSVDLMILPEAALPSFMHELPEGYIDLLKQNAYDRKMALAIGVPLLVDGKAVNAVVSVTGFQHPYYAKQHLVPFGEFMPFPKLTGWLYQYMNIPMLNMDPGDDHRQPLPMAGQKIAFNICYEDGFGSELIGPAKESTLLANVSNLAWFGDSYAMSQQLQLSQARSLELGRYMVRSTNTGMTAIIRPDGQVSALAAPNTRQVLVGEVTGMSGWTPYMYYGDWVVLALAVMMLAVPVGCAVLQSRRRKTVEDSIGHHDVVE